MVERPTTLPLAQIVIAGVSWVAWSVPTLLGAGSTVADLGAAIVVASVAVTAGIIVGLILQSVVNHSPLVRFAAATVMARALLGASAALLIDVLAAFAGLPSTIPAVARIITSAVIVAWGVGALDDINQLRVRIEQERRRLLDDASTLGAALSSESVLVAELRASMAAAIDTQLAPTRDAVRVQLDRLDANVITDWTSTAPALGAVAHDSVRPLARMLDASVSPIPARIGPLRAARLIVRTQPFHPWPLSAVYVLTTYPSYWEERGPVLATLSIAIGIALIQLILGIGNAILRRPRVAGRPRAHERVFIATAVVLQLPALASIVAKSGLTPVSATFLLATAVVSAVTVLVTSAVGAWRDRNALAQEQFRQRLIDEMIASTRRARIASLVARDAARVLHGSVQARIAVCAIEMERAIAANDVHAYATALRQAHAVLTRPLAADHDASEQAADLGAVLAEVSALWRGIAEVEVDADAVALPVGTVTGVRDVVEEAVANAVRHGGAQRVVVWVRASDTTVDIEVADDGRGPTGGAPGLGSVLISRVTNGDWSLRRDGRHTTLAATMSLPVQW